MKLKRCVDCLQEKYLSEFNKQATQKDGHAFYCRECQKIRRNAGYRKNHVKARAEQNKKRRANIEKTRADCRASYDRNKEQRRLDGIKYRADNAEKLLERRRKKYQDNPLLQSQIAKRRRAENPELHRKYRRNSYRKNKAAYLAAARKREIDINNATPPWVDMKEIAKFYAEAARLTRETGVPHQVDHFYPLKGKNSSGLHVPCNLRVITAKANRSKSNSLPELQPIS